MATGTVQGMGLVRLHSSPAPADAARATYDVFLSYSSLDAAQATRVQHFLEQYRHPRGIFGPSRLRILVFRDKTHQGLTSDFRAAFEEQINSSPSFLLLGSGAACASRHVIKECECFLATGRDSINLALLDGPPQLAFPEIMLARFPHAIHADIRMTKTTTAFRWWFSDRWRFRDEMLRIVSSILQRKSGVPLSYDTLAGRERRRRNRRLTLGSIGALILSVALGLYYVGTDPYGLQYSELGRSELTRVVSAAPGDGDLALVAVMETRKFWSDQAGHEGFDVDVAIHGLDDRGHTIGTLTFTLDDVKELAGEPKRSGAFTSFSDDRVSQLLVELGYAEPQPPGTVPSKTEARQFSWKSDCEVERGDRYLTQQFDAQRALQVCGNDHTPPSVAYYTVDAGRTWMPAAEFGFHLKNASVWFVGGAAGMTFVGTPEEVDPYYSSMGGLMVTADFGKTWEPVPPASGDWNALQLVAGNPGCPDCIAVGLGKPERSGDRDSAGLWLTRDRGRTWQPVGFQGIGAAISFLDVTESGEFAAVVNGQLLLFRKRSAVDRVLQRFDVPIRSRREVDGGE